MPIQPIERLLTCVVGYTICVYEESNVVTWLLVPCIKRLLILKVRHHYHNYLTKLRLVILVGLGNKRANYLVRHIGAQLMHASCVGFNEICVKTWYSPFQCQELRHSYEKCQYEEFERRVTIAQIDAKRARE